MKHHVFFFGTIILWSETPNFVKSVDRCGRCEGHEVRNKSKLHDKVSSRMQQPRPKKMDAGWFLATFQVRMQGSFWGKVSWFAKSNAVPFFELRSRLVKEFGVPLQRQSRDSVIDCWILVFCEALARQLRSLQSVRVTIALFACVVLSSRCFAKFWDGFCEANQAMCGLSGLYQHFEAA